MIDRYALFRINDLQSRFRLNSSVDDTSRSYNISPTQLAIVIVERDGIPCLERMKWGFIPVGAKDAHSVFRYKTFNVRSEGIFSKSQWSEAIRHRRCLVPANGFYVWQSGEGGKIPYYVRPDDQDLFAFAGIYSSWQDPSGKDWGTYSLVTVATDDARGNSDRMPIILRPETEPIWLDQTVNDASTLYDLMRPYPSEKLHVDEVGSEISSMKADNPRLVTPIRRERGARDI